MRDVQTRATVERFLTDRRDWLSAGSIRTYRQSLNLLVDVAPTLDRINRRTILKAVAGPKGTAGPGTKYMRLTVIRLFGRWCVKHRIMRSNPAELVELPAPRQRIPRSLTREQASAVLAACPDLRTRCVVELGLRCGLRRAEIANVHLEDIDFSRRTLAVRGKGGRGEVTAELPVPEAAWEALTGWVRQAGLSAGPLFPSPSRPGEPVRPHAVGKWITEAMQDAEVWQRGVRSPHSLRHSFAVSLVEAGGGVRQVQKALRHASPVTCEVYLRGHSPELRELLERAEPTG